MPRIHYGNIISSWTQIRRLLDFGGNHQSRLVLHVVSMTSCSMLPIVTSMDILLTLESLSHCWVLRCHLGTAEKHPKVYFSDCHQSLLKSHAIVMPLMTHVNGNVAKNLRASLGEDWVNFTRDFWAMYRAVSPQQFDQLFNLLITRFLSTKSYLCENLYPCHSQWACSLLEFVLLDT